MKTFLRFLAVIVFFCATAFSPAKGIAYEGGDGSTMEKAVVIKNATEETGVHAEYAYLEKHFPGAKTNKQGLMNKNGKASDVLDFTTKDGKKKKSIYFDITDFFGK